MKERGEKKGNDIFSPRNLLIGFFVVIILLLIINYFYPVFSISKMFFNQNYYNGELYSEIDEGLEEGFGGSSPEYNCKIDCKGCKRWYYKIS